AKGDELTSRRLEEIIVELEEHADEFLVPVRTVLKCRSEFGICRACYGTFLATGDIAEIGDAVGIIAAQSIGEPGTHLTMRTFHIGGVAKKSVEDTEHKAKKTGTVKFERITVVVNERNEHVALTRSGDVKVVGPKHRELESYPVQAGYVLLVQE